MLKLAAIIGGVLLMAGVAFAGTRTLLEQTTGPTLGTTVLPAGAATVSRQAIQAESRDDAPQHDDDCHLASDHDRGRPR